MYTNQQIRKINISCFDLFLKKPCAKSYINVAWKGLRLDRNHIYNTTLILNQATLQWKNLIYAHNSPVQQIQQCCKRVSMTATA